MSKDIQHSDASRHWAIRAAKEQAAAARMRRQALSASSLQIPDSLPSPSPSLPRQLANYTLLRELHRGGQGVVYLANQESTGRRVAVKVFRFVAGGGPDSHFRFEREVDVLGKLKHPNVVTIHDCGRNADEFYLVMDFVEGPTLDAYLTHQRPTLRDTLDLFARICDGVNAAHLRGIIHRDLKPENICMDERGEPRVLDFGLAKLVDDAGPPIPSGAMTVTGQFVGSLQWASPEQAEGRSDSLDLRTDVYSLGVIFYQLLTKKLSQNAS